MDYVYPHATWNGGPDWKVWPALNAMQGVVLHSAEGSTSAALGELFSEAQKSWHFSISRDGGVLQHYNLDSSCWHAGSRYWNERLIGIEHEGRAGEPLTDAQERASIALVRWIAQQCGWTPYRGGAQQTLWAHSELYGTTCPNGRIPFEAYTAAQPAPQAEFIIPEEDDVQTRSLDPNETDAVLGRIWKHYWDIKNDLLGGEVDEITGGYPLPAGVRAYVVRIPD